MPIYKVHADREAETIVRVTLRRAVASLALLVSVALISTVAIAAFHSSDLPIGERLVIGLWDTLNLISTVGSIQHSFTPWQRAWAMFVIVFGLGAVLYAFGNLQSLLHGGEVARYFTRKQMRQTLESMSGHYVVCGFGRMGSEVARRIRRSEHTLVVIEQDNEAADLASEEGFIVVEGDCEEEHALRRAGVERAAGLVTTMGDDAANVYVSLISRELNPQMRIVSRAETEQSRRALRRAGVDRCTVPGELVGLELSQLVLKPRISEFVAAAIGDGEYEFGEIEVSHYPWMHRRTLRELELPREAGILVISLIDEAGEATFNPGPETVISEKDVLLVVSSVGGIDELAKRSDQAEA